MTQLRILNYSVGLNVPLGQITSPHNQLFQSNISEIPYCTINPSSDADSLDDQSPNWDCHKQSVCEKNILKE